ncbi:MAG: sensor histidine kinase [Proteobacteria bacterium]|nr:sensor histidine kinase [Pseudomonadota bacterium]
MPKRSNLFIFFLLFFPSFSSAGEYTIYPDSRLTGNFIGEYISYFEDAKGSYDIDDVIADDKTVHWINAEKPYFSLGFTESVYWFKVAIDNTAPVPASFYIEYAYGAIDEVYFYSSDKTYSFMAGDKLPFKDRQIDNHTPAFWVQQNPGKQTYYFKVRTSGQFRVKFRLYGLNAFHKKMTGEALLYGMFFATFFIISFINYYLSLLPAISVLKQKLYLTGLLKSYFSLKGQNEQKYSERDVFLFLSFLSLTTIYNTAYYTGFAFQYLFQYIHFLFPGLVNYLFNINGILALLCCNIIARNFLILKKAKPFQLFLLWQYRILPVFFLIAIFVPYHWSGIIVPSFAVINIMIGLMWVICILLFSQSSTIIKISIGVLTFLFFGNVLELISGIGIINITNGWIEWGLRSMGIGLLFAGILYNAFYRFYVDREKQEACYLHLLRQSQKAETEINNKIAHEFLTPVTAIVMGSNRLMKSVDLPDRLQKTAQLIKDQAIQLKSLTQNYLRVVRFDKNQEEFIFKPCNLIDIIENALQMLQSFNNDPEYMHEIEFQKPADASSYHINADEENMIIAIKNIIQNAIKYTQKGGKILISLGRKKKKVYIYVADNGNGISDKNKQDIFFPFFQADYQKDFDKGIGLGLTIVNRIIHKHNGEIKIISPLEPDAFPGLNLNDTRKGSLFEICIPAGD